METATLTDNVVEFKKPITTICPFCERLGEVIKVDEWEKNIDLHLVVTISDVGAPQEHCHIHGCTDQPQAMIKMMGYINNEINKANAVEKK